MIFSPGEGRGVEEEILAWGALPQAPVPTQQVPFTGAWAKRSWGARLPAEGRALSQRDDADGKVDGRR
uniref:Uncharacterized protein n=1 Tax=Oryza rufipogon TaxID=4529 RepID=A0A0E0R8R6_ORYRU